MQRKATGTSLISDPPPTRLTCTSRLGPERSVLTSSRTHLDPPAVAAVATPVPWVFPAHAPIRKVARSGAAYRSMGYS